MDEDEARRTKHPDDDLPVEDHEKEAVDRGLAEIEANPDGGMTFEEFQERIRRVISEK